MVAPDKTAYGSMLFANQLLNLTIFKMAAITCSKLSFHKGHGSKNYSILKETEFNGKKTSEKSCLYSQKDGQTLQATIERFYRIFRFSKQAN